MKKTFLATRNTLLSSANVSWGTFALAFAIAALLLRLFAPNIFWYTFTPMFGVADAFTAQGRTLFSSFGDTAVLSTTNDQLANENAALASENQMLLKKEEALTALLGSSAKAQGIAAGVVSRPPESPYDTLLVGAGANQGVVLGMEAYGPGGVPVGTVSSVFGDFSRVTLFSAPGVATSGWIGNENVPVSVIGGGAGVMTASVARLADIAVGDAVFVPGPGALLVGSVVRIDSEPSSPSVTLRIAPAFNLFSTAWITLRDIGLPAQAGKSL